jgi:hypothetical protein
MYVKVSYFSMSNNYGPIVKVTISPISETKLISFSVTMNDVRGKFDQVPTVIRLSKFCFYTYCMAPYTGSLFVARNMVGPKNKIGSQSRNSAQT